MLPMVQKEIVENKKWASEQEVMDYYAVGQCTPGVIAVNTATFLGLKRRGIPGAIVATLGIVSPSLIIITLIASVLLNFTHIPAVGHAFAGIRVAVCSLILSAILKLWKAGVVDKISFVLCIIAFIVAAFLPVSAVYVVVGAAVTGISVKKWGGKKQ